MVKGDVEDEQEAHRSGRKEMKVEVSIPSKRKDCIFSRGETKLRYFCVFYKPGSKGSGRHYCEFLQSSWDGDSKAKHPECPAVKDGKVR
ncbi:MAG: hypothetical protein Q7J73_08205 [Dehalococcoidales bacterium]|nr:hypothetical protein [Dehalococcoidales bacterium]